MNANSAWGVLSSLSVGTVVAWIIAIASIIAGVSAGTIKLYKVFTHYKQIKDEDIRQRDMLEEHDAILKEMNETITQIKESIDLQNGVDLKVIRYILVFSCENALTAGSVSENRLKILEDMYEEYTEVFHGNGYVKGLMERVRQLV